MSTTIYHKSTATNSLLHWQSSHPMVPKQRILYGQFLRLRWNCTHANEFIRQAKELSSRFKGYPTSVLDHSNLLVPKQRNSMNVEPIRVIGTYGQFSKNIGTCSPWTLIQPNLWGSLHNLHLDGVKTCRTNLYTLSLSLIIAVLIA